jgi:hypothetical protein
MKRGWITWDKTELPPSAFDARLAIVRKHLAENDLPALVVYTDVWRSNQGRYLANFMPYWNRALLVIPRDSAPILLCGLSPRVYPWIRSVTILEDIRPNMNLPKLCDENGWKKVGVLDLPLLPSDLSVPNAVDVPWSAIHPEPDEAELSMYRHAAKMAREILKAELPTASGLIDHEFVGRLELKFRRAGAEDLVVLVSRIDSTPLPPNGSIIGEWSCVSVAMEYRGHWVKIVRNVKHLLADLPIDKTELLSGPYPYQACWMADLAPGSIFALTGAFRNRTKWSQQRLFHGDTYRLGPHGPELL